MDYKQKIKDRWLSDKELVSWLDKKYPKWHEDSPDLVADFILEAAIGETAHGNMDIETSAQAEEWIMETYLGA